MTGRYAWTLCQDVMTGTSRELFRFLRRSFLVFFFLVVGCLLGVLWICRSLGFFRFAGRGWFNLLRLGGVGWLDLRHYWLRLDRRRRYRFRLSRVGDNRLFGRRRRLCCRGNDGPGGRRLRRRLRFGRHRLGRPGRLDRSWLNWSRLRLDRLAFCGLGLGRFHRSCGRRSWLIADRRSPYRRMARYRFGSGRYGFHRDGYGFGVRRRRCLLTFVVDQHRPCSRDCRWFGDRSGDHALGRGPCGWRSNLDALELLRRNLDRGSLRGMTSGKIVLLHGRHANGSIDVSNVVDGGVVHIRVLNVNNFRFTNVGDVDLVDVLRRGRIPGPIGLSRAEREPGRYTYAPDLDTACKHDLCRRPDRRLIPGPGESIPTVRPFGPSGRSGRERSPMAHRLPRSIRRTDGSPNAHRGREPILAGRVETRSGRSPIPAASLRHCRVRHNQPSGCSRSALRWC